MPIAACAWVRPIASSHAPAIQHPGRSDRNMEDGQEWTEFSESLLPIICLSNLHRRLEVSEVIARASVILCEFKFILCPKFWLLIVVHVCSDRGYLIMAPESGAQKRKRRQWEKQLIESQRGSFHNFFKSNTSTSRNPDELALVLVGK
jgi:hypothetical protein